MILNKEVKFDDDIISRRGYCTVSRELIMSSSSEELKAFFSNFYPISIHDTLEFSSFGTLRYFGMSPLFNKIKEGEMSPEYQFTILTDDRGLIEIRCDRVNNTLK